MEPRNVKIYEMREDKDQDRVICADGHSRYPSKKVLACNGVFIGLGTMYEELRDGVGQYTTGIVLRGDTHKFDWIPLDMLESDVC